MRARGVDEKQVDGPSPNDRRVTGTYIKINRLSHKAYRCFVCVVTLQYN